MHFTKTLSAPLQAGKITLQSKEETVQGYVDTGRAPDCEILNYVVFNGVQVVTLGLLEDLMTAIAGGVTVPIPIPGTDSSRNFTRVGGVANPYAVRSKGIKISGCYCIWTGIWSYVGQATALGHRVRSHATLRTSSVRHLLQPDATVTVVRLPVMPLNVTLKQGLGLLEVAMMITYRPNLNKTWVPF